VKLDITRKTDLAVRTMLALDGEGTRMKGSELADKVCSTAGFMPQVLAPLVQMGWVRSDPGPTGGYVLRIDLDSVTMLELIEAVEGPTDRGQCVLDGGRCSDVGHCAIHDSWNRARDQLLADLATTTLRHIQKNPPRDYPCP
jgi:Rrf2 family protein